jgi:hypothetical protein
MVMEIKTTFWRVTAKIYHMKSVIKFSETSLSTVAIKNIFKCPNVIVITLVTVITCFTFSVQQEMGRKHAILYRPTL